MLRIPNDTQPKNSRAELLFWRPQKTEDEHRSRANPKGSSSITGWWVLGPARPEKYDESSIGMIRHKPNMNGTMPKMATSHHQPGVVYYTQMRAPWCWKIELHRKPQNGPVM